MGLVDSQLLARDVFVTLAMAASGTSRLRLYSAVTNPVTRHASVLAGASVTVHEMAPGRVGIIIGSGYSSLSTIGRKPATVAQMREGVQQLRRLVRTDFVTFGDIKSHLHFAAEVGPPVYIAATGPRMIRLAGEVADGVLLAAGVHPRIMALATELLHEGAQDAGRDPDELEVMLYARTVVDEDASAARTRARPMCGQWVSDKYRSQWLRAAGIDVPRRDKLPRELLDLYPDVIHAEDWDAAIRATQFLSDEEIDAICDAVGVIGTPEHCTSRLRALAEAGCDSVYLMTLDTYDFPEDTVALYERQILPQLREEELSLDPPRK